MLREEHGDHIEKGKRRPGNSHREPRTLKDLSKKEGSGRRLKRQKGKDRVKSLRAKGRNNIKERMGHSIKIFKDK